MSKRLSPDHCESILQAARPLAPSDNAAFCEEVRLALAEFDEVGDGLVHRVIRDVQRRYFQPNTLGGRHPGRWAR